MLIFYDEYFSSVQRILLEMNGYVASLSSVLQTKKFFFPASLVATSDTENCVSEPGAFYCGHSF